MTRCRCSALIVDACVDALQMLVFGIEEVLILRCHLLLRDSIDLDVLRVFLRRGLFHQEELGIHVGQPNLFVVNIPDVLADQAPALVLVPCLVQEELSEDWRVNLLVLVPELYRQVESPTA
jgi:hypothetical protein